MSQTNTKKEDGVNLLRYLGIPVLIIGITLFLKEFGSIKIYYQSADWPKVQANMLEAKINRTQGKIASVSLIGEFEYQYEGKSFKSRNINITGGMGGSNASKEEKYASLQANIKSKTPIEAWVNPANPSYAFIYREIPFDTYGIILMSLFLIWSGYKISRSIFFKASE